MPLEMVKNNKEDQAGISHRYHGVRVNWGSIFGGAFVSMGLSVLFLVLGNAIGLAASNMINPTAGGGLVTGTFIYTIVTLAISFYVGGLATSLAGDLVTRVSGMLHGMVSWALAVTFVALYGIMFIPSVRAIVAGIGPNGANWLVALTTIFSCVLATVGGGIGASRARARMTRLEAELERRDEAEDRAKHAA
ncbi:MAG: hypothetical protein HY074_11350 [Deltaproteobacteria bacterium]|nr:hypothetical protein [Deltaproteobacteria bacterium]